MSENILPPTYSLIQATTMERHEEMKAVGAKPGQLWHSLRGEAVDKIDVILIDIIPCRTYWGRGEILDAVPECGAVKDMSKSVTGEDCLNCPHLCDNPWLFDASQRREFCLPGYVVFGLDNDNDLEPFIIRASGTSAGAFRELRAVMLSPKYRQGNGLTLTISGAQKRNQLGVFYTIQISKYSPLPPEKVEELKEYIRELKAIEPGAAMVGTPEITMGEQNPENAGRELAAPTERPPAVRQASPEELASLAKTEPVSEKYELDF